MNSLCSHERLELAMAGSLNADDEAALHLHLEECESCFAEMARLSGGEQASREVAAMLIPDDFYNAAPLREECSTADFVVDHLEPSDDPAVLGRLGGYDVLDIIGRGGMGVVLKGFDRELKRFVAIKALAPHLAHSALARKRFAREAQAAAAVVNLHVIAIHQVQPNGQLPFLVMPLLTGESLAHRLKARGCLELKEILRIGMQAAEGLAAAHGQGLIHRDVKPANILLEKGVERAVLTDFGLARAADDVSMTRWGIIAGTPEYMSPEQARGEALDGRSDLFSLGCVLYEMATGVSPFRTDSTMATLRRIVDEQPAAMASLVPELPPWFCHIVERLLSKDSAQRFASASEVRQLLEQCLSHLQQPTSVPLPASLVPHAAGRRSIFNITRRGVLAMFGTTGMTLLGMVLWQATEAPDISGQWTKRTQAISAAMETSLEGLPQLYESVSKSIVRVETADNISATGVIVSSDGHILMAGGVNSEDAKTHKVHLSDGRTVTATDNGWSHEWGLGVLKINEKGRWPAIELGSTKGLKAGEPCLVIGYSPRGDTKFDSSPTARFGFIERSVPTRWFTTTCFPGLFEHCAVVGMDGRLLGIDNHFAGATAVDEFVSNRDELFASKNLDWVRYPPKPSSIYHLGAGDHPELLRLRKTDDVLGKEKPPTRMSDLQLSEVTQIATKTTVRLVSKDRLLEQGGPERWSGVIVSEDGYILTCAHTDQLPGEQLTVRLSDGRDADAVALGTNQTTDIGLVKITTPGTWPFAEIGESSTLKPGDPLLVAGYPAINNITKKEWSTERTPQIDTTSVRHHPYMIWNPDLRTTGRTEFPYQGGMSGGGVFDRHGRYVAISQGNDAPTRSEVAKVEWADLKKIESIDTATGMTHPLRKRFVGPSKTVARSVVELLVDSKPVSIGTAVDADGWILTKASVLGGKVSCRLPDQSVVVAEKRAESQEHDLALLKIDVGGLSAAAFSDNEPPSIAQALCAVGPGQILKPGIVSMETRAVPPEPRWKGDATEDTRDGAMISRQVHGTKNKTNLSTIGTKLQSDDIIVSINGHSTPNVATLTRVLETNLSGYCTGDLVSVSILRNGSPLSILTPLPRASVVNYWMVDEYDTPRRSGFAAVYDTDIELLQREVGCPVIDVEGRIRGIAIASRGRDETQRGPTSVLPSHIVSRVTKQLMAKANSK